jgi:chromate transporter
MSTAPVGFAEALKIWFKIGCLGFGGPAGQIALMHRILVDEKKWIGEARFLHALNYCMLLPGPEAQQLATYVGWMLHRTAGGLAAGLLFVLPGAAVILALSWIYAAYQRVPLVEAVFFGIKAAVLAVVIEAVIRVGKRSLKNRVMIALAAAAFVLIFAVGAPFPYIVLGAGLIGLVGGRYAPEHFVVIKGHAAAEGAELRPAEAAMAARGDDRPPPVARTLARAALWLVVWLGPVALVWWQLGDAHVFTDIAQFFSKMAAVTFGGAYAVLAYVAQEAVETYRWLAPGEMLDGLGMAETTPGPLILVLQFVGFLAAWRQPGDLPPGLAGSLGALLTLWVTFAPSFLWIFVGAPYVERLRGKRALSAALSAITAAVVGVVLNLAVWFGLHVLFAKVETVRWSLFKLSVPSLPTIDPAAAVLAAGAMLALLRFKAGMIPTLAGAALLGALYHLLLR